MDESIRENNPLFGESNPHAEILKKQQAGRRKKFNFVFGFTVVIFSLIGFLSCIYFIGGMINERTLDKKEAEFIEYNQFLLAVAAVDPKPFDDITSADSGELVEIAVWSIIGSDLEPDKYDYSSGELAIPLEEVNNAYLRYFGNDVQIVHQNVTGYGYEFSYSEENNCYYVPLTAIEPLYTPRVISSEEKGEQETLTLGLINAGVWKQDSQTGNISAPDPDKFVKVTVQHSGNNTYIKSIRSTASPEVAIS